MAKEKINNEPVKVSKKNGNTDPKMTKEESKQVMKRASLMILASYFMVILFAWLTFAGHINLSGKTKASQLTTYYQRLEFAIKYQAPAVGWLLFCCFYVIHKRVPTKAINPLAGFENVTFEANKILANSYEQFLLTFLSEIVSLSFVSEQTILKLIPFMSLSFLFGRITFFIGYPLYRGFGFNLSFAPTALLIFYNIFSFFRFVFL